MSSKSRKSLSPWMTCEKCHSTVSQKDTCLHEEECPPSNEKWSHSYIQNCILYSTVDVYSPKEFPKNLTERNTHDIVFLSQSALQLCEISIGDRVMLTFENDVIVKTAWPTNDKSLTSVCLNKFVIETYKFNGLVKVQRFTFEPSLAKEVVFEFISKHSKPKLTPELQVSIKALNENKAFCVGNRFHIPYYGRHLLCKIVKIIGDRGAKSSAGLLDDLEKHLANLSVTEKSDIKFYQCLYSTKWTSLNIEAQETNNIKHEPKITLQDIGGYQQLLEELKDTFNIILGRCQYVLKGFKLSKGVLLYGSVGVGKSTIANALLSQYNVNVFMLKAADIYSKYFQESGTKLKDLFDSAKAQAPSVIFIEDIDMLCSKKTVGDNEKRLIATLLQEIDDLQDSESHTMLLTTSSRPDSIDHSLRRPGRIDNEFEIDAPTPRMRRDILEKILSKMSNQIHSDELDHIAFTTHGFVAADLQRLCNCAAMRAIKRYDTTAIDNKNVEISAVDFSNALSQVKPSAMKEILVEVPNVKWSDIGGQDELKLKLRQAVEWPLKHPEVFLRLGITPPKGLLMFGPPGCSKTMVARALATETKLNFINIKGPELFSKWVGDSEKAVRDVFNKARQVAPSIVFIDEIDAVGGERASKNSANGGNNVQERVLAQLLTELDGVTALGNVTLVAATNRPDRIDKALLRPGRLDRLVYVPLPDAKTRYEIFKIKFEKMPTAPDVEIEPLVDLSEGYSGAEIQAICHEAAMKALEENLNANIITKEHFRAALKIVSPRTSPDLIKIYENYINNSKQVY